MKPTDFLVAFARSSHADRALLAEDLILVGIAILTPDGKRCDPNEPQRPGILVASPIGWELHEID